MLSIDLAESSVDAALAYNTDTLAESDKVDAVHIDSPYAKAVQPFSIARASEYKYLGRRLKKRIAESKEAFSSAGFNFRLDQ